MRDKGSRAVLEGEKARAALLATAKERDKVDFIKKLSHYLPV
jgi:hypothetical protein